jgi:hypothetical protein
MAEPRRVTEPGMDYASKGCGVLGCLGTFVVLSVLVAGFGLGLGSIWSGAVGIAISIVAGFFIANLVNNRRIRDTTKS